MVRNIISIGIDIVEIKSIQLLLKKNLVRFIDSIFTKKELNQMKLSSKINSTGNYNLSDVRQFTKYFAAKEAALKALKVNNSVPFEYSDLELVGGDNFKITPKRTLFNTIKKMQGKDIIGSMSSTSNHSIAVAIVYGDSK